MLQPLSLTLLVILCVMIAFSLLKPFFAKERYAIWNPITFIALTFIYYIVKPSFDDISLYGANIVPNQYMFYLTAVVFFGCVLIAFNRPGKDGFSEWNKYYTQGNTQTIALVLFIIAMVCYVPFRGFRTSISSESVTTVSARTGLVSYFIDLISLFVGACCLALVGLKDTKGQGVKKRLVIFVILYFTLVMFIVGGFRYRLVILLLAMATTYHLYPSPRRINYVVFVPIAIAAYLGFAIMDSARSYGRGINLDVAKSFTLEDAAKGAGESTDVCCFSIVVTDEYYKNGNYAGIEPIVTAALMPIPRAIIPWKPAAEYLHEAEERVSVSGGAAFLVFTEAYVAFGMIGVILYGLFIGWFLKKIWQNYLKNRQSIGALLLLALTNGFCYTWMSRGYMASAFNDFIYFVVLPFWLTALINRFSKNKS